MIKALRKFFSFYWLGYYHAQDGGYTHQVPEHYNWDQERAWLRGFMDYKS